MKFFCTTLHIVNLSCAINRLQMYFYRALRPPHYRLIVLLYSCSRNEDTDINRSKLLLSGFIGQATSNKYDDFTESFWGSRNNIENQTRQHYLARNRYIAEQNLRLRYPSVYGTQSISKYLARVYIYILVYTRCILTFLLQPIRYLSACKDASVTAVASRENCHSFNIARAIDILILIFFPIETTNKSAFQPNMFGNVFNTKASGGPHGRTDWAAKYLK